MNENILAICITILAIVITLAGLDNGDLLKTVVGAYLGFLVGQRSPKRKNGD